MNCGLCIITNAKMNELRCINPHCSKSNKTFKSQCGLTYHLNNSKNCMTYLTLHCFNVDSNNVKNTFNHMKPLFNDAMLPNKIDLMPSHNNSIFHNNVNSNKKHHLLHDNTNTIDKRLHLSNDVNANINNTPETANNNKTQNLYFSQHHILIMKTMKQRIQNVSWRNHPRSITYSHKNSAASSHC